MQSVNDKTRPDVLQADRYQIARFAALTLVFSYAELLVPRVIPFFRLGLGNAALLMGLVSGLSFPAFMLLSVIKAVAGNLMAGTLFSPFFLVSLAQSLGSALVMFGLRKVFRPKLLSLYGISVASSSVSALVQISLSSLYLGQGTWSLLGPMLLFNTISGVITAWLAVILNTVVECPQSGRIETTAEPGKSSSSAVVSIRPSGYSTTGNSRTRNIFLLTIILAVAASVFFIKNTAILGGFLLLSFLAQKLAHRKILLLPHVSLWLFVFITSVLVPNGRILFSVAGFSITEGALLSGLQKSLRLSTVAALSQCAVTIKPSENTLLGLTLSFYKLMLDSFHNTQGSVITKLKASLGNFSQQSEPSQNQKEEI